MFQCFILTWNDGLMWIASMESAAKFEPPMKIQWGEDGNSVVPLSNLQL